MFANQISTQELFAICQSSQDHIPPAETIGDFSQLQNAQYTHCDMSQANSQDFFSQSSQHSGGSTSESQSKRGPLFQKYQTKPFLFRSNSQSKIPATTNRSNMQQNPPQPTNKGINVATTFQQQLSMQKTKARERDERDLLSSIVSIVKECTDEVKCNLRSIKVTEHDSEEVLQTSFKTLMSSMEESSNKILKAMKQKDEYHQQVIDFQREIKQKDDRIQELQEQSRKNITTDFSYSMVSILEPIKAFFMDQQSLMEQKIQRILESMHEQLKLTKEYGTVQRSGIEDSNKHYLDLKYTGQRHVQDIEKRLVDELVTLRDDFDRQKRDMESLFKNQIHITQQKCVRDMEQHIHKGMTDGLRQTFELMEQSLQSRQAEIQNVCKSQQKDMEKYIKYNTTEQTKQICKQNQELYSKQYQGFKKDLQQNFDKICKEQRSYFHESKTCMEEIRAANYNGKEPPWINDTVSKKIQDQLNELHNHHQAEIKRIEAEMHSTKNMRIHEKGNIRKENCALNLCLQDSEFNRNLQNVYHDEPQSNPGNFESAKTFSSAFHHKETRFVSPKLSQVTTWKSRAIFGRTNICLKSPVATVLPQRQQRVEPSARQVDELQAEAAVTERTQPVIELHIDPLPLPVPETIRLVEPSTRQLRSRSKCSNANISQTSMVEHRPNNIQADDRNSVPVSKRNKPKLKTPRKKASKRSRKKTKDLQSLNIETKAIKMLEPSASVQTIKAVQVLSQGSTSCENDIHDESSPSHRMCQQFSDSSSMMKCLTVNGTTSNVSSNNSSPSLSLKDISIRRKIKFDRKSPANTDVKISEDAWSSVSDILSTPVLMDLYNQDAVTQDTDVSSQKPNQTIWPLRRLGEKRKLYNDEHDVMQMLQYSQKKGNYIANSIYYNVEC